MNPSLLAIFSVIVGAVVAGLFTATEYLTRRSRRQRPEPSTSEENNRKKTKWAILWILLHRVALPASLGFVNAVSIFTAIPLGIAFLVSNVLVWSGPFVYGILALFLLLPIVGTFYFQSDTHPLQIGPEGRRNSVRLSSRTTVRVMGAFTLYVLDIPMIGTFIVAAGQFFRYWAIDFGGFIAPHVTSYWDWVAYAAYWVLDGVFANVGQIFGWEQTTIHPVALAARIAVLVYNILLELVIIVAILQAVNRVRSGKA